MEDLEDFWDDDEFQPYDACPKCQLYYDELDHEFQCCRQCGWDAEKCEYGERRKPTHGDYMAGDADILTGRWY